MLVFGVFIEALMLQLVAPDVISNPEDGLVLATLQEEVHLLDGDIQVYA